MSTITLDRPTRINAPTGQPLVPVCTGAQRAPWARRGTRGDWTVFATRGDRLTVAGELWSDRAGWTAHRTGTPRTATHATLAGAMSAVGWVATTTAATIHAHVSSTATAATIHAHVAGTALGDFEPVPVALPDGRTGTVYATLSGVTLPGECDPRRWPNGACTVTLAVALDGGRLTLAHPVPVRTAAIDVAPCLRLDGGPALLVTFRAGARIILPHAV